MSSSYGKCSGHGSCQLAPSLVLCILDWCKSHVTVHSQGIAEMLLQWKLLTKLRELLFWADIPFNKHDRAEIPATSLGAAVPAGAILGKGC